MSPSFRVSDGRELVVAEDELLAQTAYALAPPMTLTPLSIAVTQETAVSALAAVPQDPSACVVFAHGAGAGMNHPSIRAICDGLAMRGIATLRYPNTQRRLAPIICH